MFRVDRLGRSLIDLLDFLRELHAKGVDLYQRIFPRQSVIPRAVAAAGR